MLIVCGVPKRECGFVCPKPYLSLMHDTPYPLIRLFLGGTAVGFALSALFVTGIWLLDIAGIHTRTQNTDDAFLILFILWFFNGLLFGAVQISYQVWQIGRDGQ